MSRHDPRPLRADAAEPPSRLADLTQRQGWLIGVLRLWDGGPRQRAAAVAQVGAALGPVAAARSLAALDRFLDLLFADAARPLRRARPGCSLVTDDEVAVARMLSAAACGAREQALWLGFALVRADRAPALAAAAEQAGLALGMMDEAVPEAGRPGSATLH